MKIFNWVHRRFNHVSLKDDLARNEKRADEEFKSEADKQALLKQVALVGVLGGWKDGILTIGTLGFDPVAVKPSNPQNAYFVLGSEAEAEAEDSVDKEQVKEYTIECDNDKKIAYDEDDQICREQEEEEEEVNPLILTGAKRVLVLEEGGTDTKDVIPGGISSNVPEIISDQKKKKGERVTLAELFLAESDDDKAKKKEVLGGPDDKARFTGKKQAPCSKNGKWFAKKLLVHGSEDSKPIKKLSGLMRKMLKKKIHPELDGKGCKMGDQNKPNADVHVNKRNGAAELAFLLPTSSGATI